MWNFLCSHYIKFWFVLLNEKLFFAETLLKVKGNFTLIYWKNVKVVVLFLVHVSMRFRELRSGIGFNGYVLCVL